MDLISLPSTSITLDRTVAQTASKLRDVFSFNRAKSGPIFTTWTSSLGNFGSLSRSQTNGSSVFSSDSDDLHSVMSPVPPGIAGSPGDPHDLTPVDPIPITLVDHSMDDGDDNGQMWARSAWVGDYSIVAGAGKAGAYVTWLCVIETVEGRTIQFRKRYSEFCQLQNALSGEFPLLRAAIPGLPPKSIISKFRPAFLEERRRGLEYFLACIVLNPVFAGSTVVKDFISFTDGN
ncbi:Phox homologous domain-containing protein [Lipomyces chichibuensis]|uniref:Phox homologous domain-containing protein n=1 Tax=Lipomyces chichibuensis TaxID=1546026 RepID=UPI003343763D